MRPPFRRPPQYKRRQGLQWALRVDAAPTAERPLSSSWQAREADCPTEKAELCATEHGRGVRRGSAQRAPLLNPCSRPRAGGEPPQWENQTDKGVVRPAARSARTRPRRTCSIFLLRWGTGGPLTDRRAAPGPTRAGGVWLVQIPPEGRSPRLSEALTAHPSGAAFTADRW